MTFKFVSIIAFIAVASAGILPAPKGHYATPQVISVAQPAYAKSVESYEPHPKYQYSYAVHDEHTGDIKSHIESRDGDVVQGEYTLVDSDGYKRIVHYTADHDHGFNAVVERQPLNVKVAPVIKAAPVVYAAAPAFVKSGAVAYSAAPALQYSTAPAAYASQPVLNTNLAYPYQH